MICRAITLWTGNLLETRDFYRDILELKVSNENPEQFTVHIGITELTFKATDAKTNPFYHFAINIPENQISEAKAWAKSKVKLNTEEEEEEVFFESWNAHAVYFEDPSGNLVEFIARHNLETASTEPFSSNALLQISEIGIVADEVIPFVRKLNQIGIPNWRSDGEGLTPVGDEQGLFIVVKNDRRWFFSELKAAFHPVEISVEGVGRLSFTEINNVMLHP